MRKMKITAVPILIVLAVLLFGAILFMERPEMVLAMASGQIIDEGGSGDSFLPNDPERRLKTFANQNGLTLDAWPEELIARMRRFPETVEFILHYPLLKDTEQTIDLSEYENCTQIPHLLQWDDRWGYTQYGDGLMGVTGCGPTCLSMVSIYLLQDTGYTPRYIADFGEEKGYYMQGQGSTWSLITEGGETLGLDVAEIPLHWGTIRSYLEDGDPIICVLGPGDFTDNGHFVVLTDVEDDKVKLLDPNGIETSERLWEFSELEPQIENLWVCKRPE